MIEVKLAVVEGAVTQAVTKRVKGRVRPFQSTSCGELAENAFAVVVDFIVPSDIDPDQVDRAPRRRFGVMDWALPCVARKTDGKFPGRIDCTVKQVGDGVAAFSTGKPGV